jgi:hypothetical protein
MSAFDPDTASQDVAFRLVADSFVRLFWRRELLDSTLEQLEQHGYQIVSLDAASWTREADMHRAMVEALDFPGYYGHNLNALNDCLRDVVAHDYGARADATGLVVVFTAYDVFARRCPEVAQAVLEIIAIRARAGALVGHRVCCLVQSDDPHICFDPVGARPVLWNDAEWIDSQRGNPRT